MHHSMIPKFGHLDQKIAHSSRKCAIRINVHRYAPPKIYIGDLQCMQTACGLIFCLPNYSIIVMTDRLACSNQCIHDDRWQCNAHTPFIVFMNTPLPKKSSRGLHMIIFEDVTGTAVNYRSWYIKWSSAMKILHLSDHFWIADHNIMLWSENLKDGHDVVPIYIAMRTRYVRHIRPLQRPDLKNASVSITNCLHKLHEWAIHVYSSSIAAMIHSHDAGHMCTSHAHETLHCLAHLVSKILGSMGWPLPADHPKINFSGGQEYLCVPYGLWHNKNL
jgi:hypothetical protein